jgi:Protein of unknown function (DUF1549)/Protein of unknown function (DUF1553)
MSVPRMAIAAILLLMAARHASADDLLPADRPIEDVIDHYVEAKITNAGLHPAPSADDATFLRRITLDLLGRIPTAAELRAFVETSDPAKRAKLVDRLMASPGFVRHQTDSFEAMLMAGTRGEIREYLGLALAENRPWDAIFRDVIVGDDSDPRHKGSTGFLKARAKDTDRLTSDVSSIFFGVNVSCAKCHDHPRVKAWTQDLYYGVKSFLDRTTEVENFVGEREYGTVKFKTTDGVEKRAKFMFLTGRVVDVAGSEEPSKEVKKEEKRLLDLAKKKKSAPPRPRVSARAKLVEVSLEPSEREFFARSIANRLWDRLFGVGLVMPLDQMHSENPPSHPELLAWLARDTIEHRYDLNRLIRGLVLSRAYARSSVWDSAEAPDPGLFAVAKVRPLTPLQLAASMWVASIDPANLSDDEHGRKVEDLAGRGQSLASALARPGEDYQIGVSEALLMSNSDRLKDLLADGGDRLVGRLVKTTDRREKIDVAVRSILSRPADDEEIRLLGDFLARHEDRPVEGCRQLTWALLTCAEFRFNH